MPLSLVIALGAVAAAASLAEPTSPLPALLVRLPTTDAQGPVHAEQTAQIRLDDDLQQHVTVRSTLANDGPPVTIDLAVPVHSPSGQHPELQLLLGATEVPCALVAAAAPPVTHRCEASVVLPAGRTELTLAFTSPLLFAQPPADPWEAGTARQLLVPALAWTVPARRSITMTPGPLPLPSLPGWTPQGESWSLAGTGEAVVELPVAARDRLVRLGAATRDNLVGIEASSVLPDEPPSSYGPQHLSDARVDTAWCEGVAGTGEGSSLMLRHTPAPPKAPPPTTLRLALYAGYAKSTGHWTKNGRPTSLLVSGCDGRGPQVVDLPLTDTPELTVTEVPAPPLDPSGRLCVRIELAKVAPGASYEDTCLSALFVHPETRP